MADLITKVKAAFADAGDNTMQGLLNALAIILDAVFAFVGTEM